LNPKLIFEMYSKTTVKNFKNDEKGLRVTFNKMDINLVKSSKANENISIYHSISVQNNEEAYLDNLNNEFQDLSKQLKILQNSNSELNTKIKETNNYGRNSKI
jgi:hypothetical protein